MCAEEIIPNTWGDLVGTDFLEKTSWSLLDNGEVEESEIDPEVYNRIIDSLQNIPLGKFHAEIEGEVLIDNYYTLSNFIRLAPRKSYMS